MEMEKQRLKGGMPLIGAIRSAPISVYLDRTVHLLVVSEPGAGGSCRFI